MNPLLFCSYNITSILLKKFSLIIEYAKMEIFHFFRLNRIFNPLLLNLSILDGSILCSRETWKYLGFIFNRKLSFHQYVDFYMNKAILMVKYTKILENSVCNLISYQKQLLYKSCVLPIALYMSRSLTVDLVFSFLFLFSFHFHFHFLFLELGLGLK